MADIPHFPSLDAIAEIRYSTNGGPAEKRDSTLSPPELLAWQADAEPPSQTKIDYLSNCLLLSGVKNDGATGRLAYVNSSHQRYRLGVPVSGAKARALRTDSRNYIEDSPRGLLPRGIIDKAGAIDTCRLQIALPESIRRQWPIDSQGVLLTDSETLKQIGTDHSRALLGAKRKQRDWALHQLLIDGDGRHRSWPNPFGTITGRDNPMGPSWARLARDQREILVPKAGCVLVTLDYQQQEPAIALCFAGDPGLLRAYEEGDLYSHIEGLIGGDLGRDLTKKLVISYLYGATANTLMRKFGMSRREAAVILDRLDKLFALYRKWSDQYLQAAYASKRVFCLDWQMAVHTGTPIRTVRNWPIQAAGADILRRVCLSMDAADIPIVGCLHDSVMLEIPLADYEATIERAVRLMGDASAEVLEGFRLKIAVERTAFPPGYSLGGQAHG